MSARNGHLRRGADWYRSRYDAGRDEFLMYHGEHLPTLSDESWLPLPPELANVPDPRVDVVGEVLWRFRVAELRNALEAMRHREAYVIRGRYGIDGPEQTLEEIGRQLGVTRERVRQIQYEAENNLCAYFGMPSMHVKTETPSARKRRLAYGARYRAARQALRA